MSYYSTVKVQQTRGYRCVLLEAECDTSRRIVVHTESYQGAAKLSASPGQLSDGGVRFRKQRLLQAGQQGIQPAALEQTHRLHDVI